MAYNLKLMEQTDFIWFIFSDFYFFCCYLCRIGVETTAKAPPTGAIDS